MDGRKKESVKPGTAVKIKERKNEYDLIEGIVKEIIGSRLKNNQNIEPSFDFMKQIKGGENSNTEFKSSFRFDIKRFAVTGEKTISKEVEKSISKTIAAFMNAD